MYKFTDKANEFLDENPIIKEAIESILNVDIYDLYNQYIETIVLTNDSNTEEVKSALKQARTNLDVSVRKHFENYKTEIESRNIIVLNSINDLKTSIACILSTDDDHSEALRTKDTFNNLVEQHLGIIREYWENVEEIIAINDAIVCINNLIEDIDKRIIELD